MAVTAFTVAEAVREIVAARLDECGRPPVVSYTAAGQIAYDDCCGLMVVAPERVFYSSVFPDEAERGTGCSWVAVDLLVVVVRCVPTVDERGRAPSPDALAAAYEGLLADAAVVWEAVAEDRIGGWLASLTDQSFAGADGGCVAVETRLTVGVDVDRWCLECGP